MNAASSPRAPWTDLATQRWVRFTGRKVRLADHPWLAGPTGPVDGIGPEFFGRWAEEEGLALERGPDVGLLPSLAALDSPSFRAADVAPGVRDFYERTGRYEIDAWSRWRGGFHPFGWLLSRIFSRRLQQLNVPLSPLDTSRGMTSEVVSLRDGGRHVATAWTRTLRRTGDVIYAGAYSTAILHSGLPCVKVVFPLPNGNAMVLMRPEARADGSLEVVSSGDAFGDPGFYFTVRAGAEGGAEAVWVRHVRTMRERIVVWQDGADVRADHLLRIWGLPFLELHYRLSRSRAPLGAVE